MGTQKEIAKKIRSKRADYVLTVKGNQKTLHEELKEYFETEEFIETIKKEGGYKKQTEKAHGQIETREYYQTQDIKWITSKKEWTGLKSIGMEKKDDRECGQKENGNEILYQQFGKGYRNNEPGGKRALEYRKYALAFGRDV